MRKEIRQKKIQNQMKKSRKMMIKGRIKKMGSLKSVKEKNMNKEMKKDKKNKKLMVINLSRKT